MMDEGAKDNGAEEREAMVVDTPDRSRSTQIATSITKFEDSPVFNFLNSLSPIQPVKSVHISQTINPLSFASIPSVFTSPHVSSLKGSRFLRRHQVSDPSKPEFSSDERVNVDRSKVDTDAAKQIDEPHENRNPTTPNSEVISEPSHDCSMFAVEFSEYKIDACQEVSQRVMYKGEGSTKEVNDDSKEANPGEWDNLISTDLLIFESPSGMDSNEKSVEPGMSFYASIEHYGHITHSICAVGSDEQAEEGGRLEHLSIQSGEVREMVENEETCDIIAGPSMTNQDVEKIDYEHLSGIYRGMRRRCLVFEMAANHKKNLDETMGAKSSLLLQSDGNESSDEPKTVLTRTCDDSSRGVLPGIGLHLNALAATPKDYKIVTHDSSTPRRLLIGPGTSLHVHLYPSTAGQESIREIDSDEIPLLPQDDTGQASGNQINEDLDLSSPKRKRRRPEQAAEGEACKRCNCKKSKCLKLYCECFAAGVYCVEPCACIDCFNKPAHEDTVLATRKQIESRNPLAFAPKVIRGSDSLPEVGNDPSKTPASARHKRGCNCKKSGCLKKYCECYQGGVGCSINCRCEGCKNAFGRKDGSGVLGIEAEEDETDKNEKLALDPCTDQTTVDSVPPTTPLCTGRQLVQLPFSSKKKPPRSFPSIASSSASFYATTQPSGKAASFCQPPVKFDTVGEEMLDFLEEPSPVSGVKSSSPKQKRVSPPHSQVGLRSSRKLILRSIPSFPSLNRDQ